MASTVDVASGGFESYKTVNYEDHERGHSGKIEYHKIPTTWEGPIHNSLGNCSFCRILVFDTRTN